MHDRTVGVSDAQFQEYAARRAKLVPLLEKWNRWELIPLYLGAGYFAFNKTLCQAYLGFENWAARTGRANLATYYVLAAER